VRRWKVADCIVFRRLFGEKVYERLHNYKTCMGRPSMLGMRLKGILGETGQEVTTATDSGWLVHLDQNFNLTDEMPDIDLARQEELWEAHHAILMDLDALDNGEMLDAKRTHYYVTQVALESAQLAKAIRDRLGLFYNLGGPLPTVEAELSEGLEQAAVSLSVLKESMLLADEAIKGLKLAMDRLTDEFVSLGGEEAPGEDWPDKELEQVGEEEEGEIVEVEATEESKAQFASLFGRK